MSALEGVGLFLAGLLAGIELVVRYGVHPALVALPDQAHLRARHEVVRIVRVIVPINDRFFEWDPDSPPAEWKVVITRWALIDVFRSSAAILAFILFLIAVGIG